MEEEKKNKAYTFVKNTTGSLTFYLEAYDTTLPKRRFHFGAQTKKIIVPYVYALGLFVSESAYNQYDKLGLFKIENRDELLKDAASLGLCAYEEEEKKEEPIGLDKIFAAIKTENAKEFLPLLKTLRSSEKSQVVIFVNKNKDKLRGETIREIGKALNITL